MLYLRTQRFPANIITWKRRKKKQSTLLRGCCLRYSTCVTWVTYFPAHASCVSMHDTLLVSIIRRQCTSIPTSMFVAACKLRASSALLFPRLMQTQCSMRTLARTENGLSKRMHYKNYEDHLNIKGNYLRIVIVNQPHAPAHTRTLAAVRMHR